MSCSSCGSKSVKRNAIRHDSYFLGEKGFVEIRYNGWTTPYRTYGEVQLYEFDDNSREKLVDKRDVSILLADIVDGVKVFDTVEGNAS